MFFYLSQQLTGPPVQIYHPAFTTCIRGVPRITAVGKHSHKELDAAAKLISTSFDFFEDESDRQTKLNKLNALGGLISLDIKLDTRTIALGGTTTIFCPSSTQDATIRITDLKNNIEEGRSDPVMQAERKFVLICSSEMVALSVLVTLIHTQLLLLQYKPFRNASCCQMFLIGAGGGGIRKSPGYL